MTVWKAAVLWAGGLLLCGGSASVHAQTCDANADCPKGFTCEVTGGGACATPAIACAPGEKCPDPPPCDPTIIRSCVAAPCTVDSDCADGMVCYEQKSEICTGTAVPPCVPGSACPEPAPAVCTDTSTRTCTPRYLLPCTDDASCGPGFTCKDVQSCGCSGSAGVATPPPALPPAVDGGMASGGGSTPSSGSGGTPTPAIDAGPAQAIDGGVAAADGGQAIDPQPTCSCQSTGEKSCDLNDIACGQDSDCPAHFTCENVAAVSGVTVSCAVPPGGVDAGPCNVGTPPPSTPVLRCRPPYEDAVRGVGFGTSGDIAPSVGTTAPIYNGGSTSASTAPKTPTAEQDTSGDNSVGMHAKACSVSDPGARHSGAAWFALIAAGLALAVSRRRYR